MIVAKQNPYSLFGAISKYSCKTRGKHSRILLESQSWILEIAKMCKPFRYV